MRFLAAVFASSLCLGQALPSWLTLGAEQRTRYETQDVRYRPGETGGDQQLPLRTRAHTIIDYKWFFATAEVQDARVALTDTGSTITPQQENFTHLLQGYAGVRLESAAHKYQTTVEVGRFSRAVGSGRLVGAEAYRNTSSVYDGITGTIGTKAWTAQGFYFHPVLYTYPNVQVNPVYRDARLGGVNATYHLRKTTVFEAFVIHHQDGESAPATTRRNYTNEGGRFTAQRHRWEYQAEAAYQHGRLGTATHKAWFTHLEAKYSAAGAWRPGVTLQYDYASGTKTPASGNDHTFDPVFGIRRNDLGPTGIWSLALRSNLNSPSVRLQLTPFKNAEFIVHHHWLYLAQARDQWRGVGLVDPTGNAGRTIGQQTEFRLRYRWSKHFDTDTAYVLFLEGAFVRTLKPTSPGAANYFYVSTDVHF